MKAGTLAELVDVTKAYTPEEGGDGVPVLKGVSLAIQPGESVAIVGPSGSGKSTLLNLLGTLDAPTAGRVLFDGRDVGDFKPGELASFRNRHLGFVFQMHHLLPHCTVFENILIPGIPAGWTAEAANEKRGRRLLARVGLAGKEHSRPGQLSGGERQRVAVVRALINSPRLLLADEPTGALDTASASSLVGLLVELNREENVTLVMVTHSTQQAQRMQRIVELKDGVIVVAG